MDEDSVENAKVNLRDSVEKLSDTIQSLSDTVEKLSYRFTLREKSSACLPGDFPQSYISEVWNSVSMPGLKFIGEKLSHWLHTYLWVFIHVFGLFISYSYIMNEYDKWQSSPIVRTVSNTLKDVSEFPFPAVTFCVPNTIKQEYDFRENLEKCLLCNRTRVDTKCYFNNRCTYDEMARLAVEGSFCPINNFMTETPTEAVFFPQEVNSSVEWDQYIMYMSNVHPRCDLEILQINPRTNVTVRACLDKGFEYFISEGPLCITINGLKHADIYKENVIVPLRNIKEKTEDKKYLGSNWALENMDCINGSYDSVPMYISGTEKLYYSIQKRKNTKHLKVCNYFPEKAAWMAVHSPAEIPVYKRYDYSFEGGEFISVEVMPNLVTTQKGLDLYEPSKRGCFHSYERELSLFKLYTEKNCEMECHSNCSLENCGCVPYFLPRQNNSIRVCISECKIVSCDCNCLPNCISLSYDILSISSSEIPLSKSTHIKIQYKKSKLYTTVRVNIYTFEQFVAYSFGILGVFNGFSVIVLFELSYFVTVRLWSSVKTYLYKNV